MGCDIHLHTEIKLNGAWHHVNTANMKRDYQMFGYLVGIMYENHAPLAPGRGLPEDASIVTKMANDCMGGDSHSHSYLTAQEIVSLEKWMLENRPGRMEFVWPELQWGYLFGNSWAGFTKYPDERPKGIEDVRFVFWFDN